MNIKKFELKSNGWKIVGQTSYPKKTPCPAVILLHGFTNTADDCPINRDMFDLLPGKRYAAVEFDFIGSGLSDGIFKDKTLKKMYKNFQDVLALVKKDKLITDIGVVGKSICGIFPVMENDPRIKSIALLSTAIRPTVQFYRAWRKKTGYNFLYFGKAKDPKVNLVLGQEFFKELPELEKKTLANVPKIKNVIHFHGTADNSCPFDQGHFYHLKNTLPPPLKSIIVEGVGHQYDGKESFIINETIEWFNKFLRK